MMRALGAIALVACICHAGPGRTAEVKLAAVASAGYTDNIGVSSSAAESSTIGSAGVDLTVARNSGRTIMGIAGSVERREYSREGYSGEWFGFLTGRVSYAIAPERLLWIIEEDFGQTRRDLFQPASPENRALVNYFTTGPDFLLRFGSATNLRLGARYSRVDYQYSPFDSNRWLASATVTRAIASGAGVHLGVQRQHTLTEGGAPEYKVNEAMLGYSVSGARTTLLVEAGVSQLEREADDEAGARARLELRRQLSPRTALLFRVGRELTDAAGLLRIQQSYGNASSEADAAALTAEPFTRNHAGLDLELTGHSSQLGLGVSFSEDDYSGASAFGDRRQYGAALHLDRRLGPRLSAGMAANWVKDDFLDMPGDARELRTSLRLGWTLGRRTMIELIGERSDRDSDVPGASGDDNRVWLRLRFGDADAGQLAFAGGLPALPSQR